MLKSHFQIRENGEKLWIMPIVNKKWLCDSQERSVWVGHEWIKGGEREESMRLAGISDNCQERRKCRK